MDKFNSVPKQAEKRSRRSQVTARQIPERVAQSSSPSRPSLALSNPLVNKSSVLASTNVSNPTPPREVMSDSSTHLSTGNNLKSASALYSVPSPSPQPSDKEVIVPVTNSTRAPPLSAAEHEQRQIRGDKVGWIGGVSVCLVALCIAVGLFVCHKRRKNKKPPTKEHAAFWDDELDDGLESSKDGTSRKHSPPTPISFEGTHRPVARANRVCSEFEDDPPKRQPFAWLTVKAFSRKPPRELQAYHIGEKRVNRQIDTIQMEKKHREKIRASVPMPPPVHSPQNFNGYVDRGSFCPTAFDEPQEVVSHPLRCNGHLDDVNSPPLDFGKDGYGIVAKEAYGHYTLPPAAIQRQKLGKKNSAR